VQQDMTLLGSFMHMAVSKTK